MRPQILNYLFSQLSNLSGIGDKKIQNYQKLLFKKRELLEFNRKPKIMDLLFHLPINIQYRKIIKDIKEANEGEYVIAVVKVINHCKPNIPKAPYQINCFLNGAIINIIYYKYYESYLNSKFKEGVEVVVSGKFEKFIDQKQIVHPDFILNADQIDLVPCVEAIYPLTYNIYNQEISKNIKIILNNIPDLPEWLDNDIIQENQWLSWKESLVKVHNPEANCGVLCNKYLKRLAFDELLAKQLAFAIIKKNINKKSQKIILENQTGNLKKYFIGNKLKFQLTDDQKNVLNEIEKDTFSNIKMLRLLQGDVGSGKTIVAFLSMLNYIENKKQCVLMVPTSILATQHYEYISNLCKDEKINIALLTGKIKGKKRDEIVKKLADGEIDILIGTHAIIEENIVFKDLRFAVIDEQHRFGVQQRLILINKNESIDILSMTATPIPRTLALTIYNDMALSVIKEKPKNRKEIITLGMSMSKYNDLIGKIRIKMNSREKIYWICPLIEENEELGLSNVEDKYTEFCKIFTAEKVAFIHGKMKEKEKDEIMEDFCNINSTKQLLIATTVIEVGIDIKEASLIIIEHPERFGLSQLHQLRGRVGRGELQSYCILLYDNSKMGKNSFQRLSIMKSTNDGFIIAEEDLALRGVGEVLGLKQSGDEEYLVANMDRDFHLLEYATEKANEIIENGKARDYLVLLYLFNYVDFIKNKDVLN